MIRRVFNSEKDNRLDDLGWEELDYYGEEMNENSYDNGLTEIYENRDSKSLTSEEGMK